MKQLCTCLLLVALTQGSLAQLSGPLSGTLGPGEYDVVGNISVESSDTLVLMPGTTFNFNGPYPFEIFGTLLAEGTENDSIIFSSNTQDNRRRWLGVRFFNNGGARSALAYCVIENAVRIGASGGGVCCYESSPILSNCLIRGNKSHYGGGMHCIGASSPVFQVCTFTENHATYGGGVFCATYSSPSFLDCVFEGNEARNYGGGVYCQNRSSPTFMNCAITNNEAGTEWGQGGGGVYCESSSATFNNCSIDSNNADHSGGGVYCFESSPSFTACTFNDNSVNRYGGGIYCSNNSEPVFDLCSFNRNYADQNGGGVRCINASPIFTSCDFTDNSARWDGGGVSCEEASPTFVDCIIVNNHALSGGGGGVYCHNSSPDFIGCAINNNSAASYGGGIECGYQAQPRFTRCSISNNSGIGISCQAGAAPDFYACIIDNNSNGGLFSYHSSPSLTHCTITRNEPYIYGGQVSCFESFPIFNSTIIAHSEGPGIFFESSANCTINYCNIIGSITFHVNDPSHGPPGIGDISTTNVNGDPCDTYYNIFLNPMFVDTAEGNYHLLWNSPCIDAGDPELPHDPDYTIADIGAFYYHQHVAVEPVAVLPTSHALHPNWPNPFNPTTTIRYDVKQTGQVRLAVFNLLGQRIAMLTDSRHLAGSYTISWNANDLPSGIYLCRMETPDFMQTRKLVLVK